MIGRGGRVHLSIFPIFPRAKTRGAGLSTWHSVGFGGTGCYGVIGPDPSAVLDKLHRKSAYRAPGSVSSAFQDFRRL
jgi:hypothetical protein